MLSHGRSSSFRAAELALTVSSLAMGPWLLSGCASPGAPKPPSLHLPQPVKDLAALRSGDNVELRFTVPTDTTDNLPLGNRPLLPTLCRQQPGTGPCKPVPLPPGAGALRAPQASASSQTIVWTDPLPSDLATGSPRLLIYRLEFKNEAGHSAGYSNAARVAAGAAPPPVQSFTAQGVRPGVLFHWTPEPGSGEVLLERTQLDPPPGAEQRSPKGGKLGALTLADARPKTASAENGSVWLQAAPGKGNADQTIDGTVSEGVRYRYIAVRRSFAQVGNQSLELRSAPSTPVELTWRDIYPPATPTGLTAVGFATPATSADQPSAYAVDLIWQAVQDLRVTGYVLSRVPLSPDGTPQGPPERLTPQPVTTPAFHDASARPDHSYRYEVSAVDAKDNISKPALAVVNAAEH